ncbi:LacI family DNA-binding transcriptional regulator [Streptomyces sp. NPDC051577]|uniref:LacI family DNA-binding transcriptional regulator n=1 Tax=Streptomyces sp. NPDC051577 TaxID=3155166 RepID=UPI0034411226
MARRPTIKDIARRSGVSESAVSFALNDRPGVSEDTRARVRRIAEELGWQPNSAARALSGERSGAVGLVLARPARTLGAESFFLRLVSGVQEVLSAGRIALLFQVVEDVDTECAVYRRWWAERRVDGVIVVDPRIDDPRPELLAGLGLPAVMVGGPDVPGTEPPGTEPARPELTGPAAPPARLPSTIRADDAGAMIQVLEHLHGLGHRRITHLAGLPGLAHTARRMASLRTWSEGRGLGPDRVRSVVTDYSDTEGAAATRRILAEPAPPTALVFDNDVMALAGLAVATELGIPVPARLSIVAWDDSALCRVTHPRLTALVRDTAAFGRLAAEELMAVLAGGVPRTRQSELPRLEPRESTGPPPTAY